MVVYLTAFLLTVLFIRKASFYYKRIATDSVSLTAFCASENADFHMQFTPLEKDKFRKRYCIYFIFAFLPLFLVSALRYGVGTDYFYTYVPNFLLILEGEMPYSEIGFNYLNKFIQIFTENPQWLFVVTGFIFSFVLIRTSVRYSYSATLSVLISLISCIFFFSLNNVRQAVAFVIVFAGFPYIINNNFIKYCLCVLVALVFHNSAIIMIVPYVAIHIKTIRKNFLTFAVILTVALPIICKIIELILKNTKYNYFFASDFNNGDANFVNIFYNLFFFCLTYFVLKRRVLTDKFAYALVFMQFCAFWVSSVSLFISISEMISRTTMYFQVFNVLLIPYCYGIQKDKFSKNVFLALYLVAYTAYFFYFIILRGYYQVLPYKWVF